MWEMAVETVETELVAVHTTILPVAELVGIQVVVEMLWQAAHTLEQELVMVQAVVAADLPLIRVDTLLAALELVFMVKVQMVLAELREYIHNIIQPRPQRELVVLVGEVL